MRHIYMLESGRSITRDGIPIATIHRVGTDATGYTLTPVEADDLANAIVAALNAAEIILAEATR